MREMFDHDAEHGAERRREAASKSEIRDLISHHAHGCPLHPGVRELQSELKDLWKKVLAFESLGHRVTAVEDAMATIETNIASTMRDIHSIQTSLAETNILRLWVGRVVIGILSAAVTFFTAKYT